MSPPNDKSISRNKYSVEIKESNKNYFHFVGCYVKAKAVNLQKKHNQKNAIMCQLLNHVILDSLQWRQLSVVQHFCCGNCYHLDEA
ncbi:hypothetical protein HNY73_013468 [Argiope bruennichi]|uniref:Uncharacterized protein n=1 Tax=Argiope bruennichi TaxID=94029 RepID=A0A8T0EY32_ARGBR|nr:hypothetical protein HNY73_013468 [Argiope bruennichi]